MSQNYLVLSHSAMWRFVVLHTDQCLILTQMKNERLRGSRTGWHALATWAWAVTIRGGIRFSSGSKVLKDFFVENGLECDKAKLEKKVSRRILTGITKKRYQFFFCVLISGVCRRKGRKIWNENINFVINLSFDGWEPRNDGQAVDRQWCHRNVIKCHSMLYTTKPGKK